MSKFILISISIFLPLLVQAQFDSLTWGPGKWKPSLVRGGINIYRGIESLAYSDKLSYEITGEIDFHKYFVTAEFGMAQFQRGNDFDYQSTGTFFRMGLDQNLIPYNPDRDVISIGLRYARSSFDEEISFETASLGSEMEVSARNTNLSASWIEATTGMKVNLTTYLTIGYVFRAKLWRRLSGDGELETFDIPGFGRNKRNGEQVKKNTVGFDYYVYWTIPFRKKYIPPKPSK